MTFNNALAKLFVEKKIIDQMTCNKYLDVAESNNTPLYVELSKLNQVDKEDLYEALASFFNVKFRTVQIVELNFDLIYKFPRQKLIELKVMPIEENENNLVFAVSDPLKVFDLEEFKGAVDKNIEYFIVTPHNMDGLINYFDNKIQQRNVIDDYKEEDKDAEAQKIVVDAPIIKLCDSILKDALSRGASDIHIEPFPEQIVLRYRIDGKLVVIDRMKTSIYQAILARYKIMSEMNIAERRVPQDGKINLTVNDIDYDFRVSTIPTINGEKIVIRIFNTTFTNANIDALGFNEREKQLVLNMISRPHGIILLTGPTGSGKSTTLYTFLRHLNREDTNIITVEDPVENQIDGINQVQVNPKANMTFANALRSILRQDPNIVMIGEIRDEETAQIATRAAITGHLVLSTIHTNSAAGVVSRLINMGVPPYLVSDSLLGSISQRLVRKLCPHCKKEHTTNEAEMKTLGLRSPKKIYSPVGCKLCNRTGYSGRTGVFEIMVCDETVRNEIMKPGFTTESLNKLVSKNMNSILERCKERVLNGETSMEEYNELTEVIAKSK